MGCSASTAKEEDSIAALRNSEIDRQLAQEKKQLEAERKIKLLLLGPGESGKSTILKQMTLIYGNGFSQEQIEGFRSAIQLNILVSMASLIKAMDNLHIPYGFQTPESDESALQRISALPMPEQLIHGSSDEIEPLARCDTAKSLPANAPVVDQQSNASKASLQYEEGKRTHTNDLVAILASREYAVKGGTMKQDGQVAEYARHIKTLEDTQFGFNLEVSMTPETIVAVKTLWADSGIQYCFSRSHEFQLIDSCSYVMANIDRITTSDFKPTEDDILNARIMTIGVHETKFKISNKMTLAIYDVGGQRSERKKWAQFFSDTQSIIFLIAISSYDQVCLEDDETNRVVESMNLFSSICNHPLFKKTDLVLFLNKIDLFEEKIQKRPISLYFQDYDGPNTLQESSKYFVKRFMDINKYPNDKQIYPHLTHATEPNRQKR
ncbi:guanine nucleotide binding protein, alpha subunit [Rhizoclosmatium globosum]|uniref:Guanine nucleotide binding protein, alpha subunit n=1 Tax=Rhizoclosmatium globosum TaxID=329046 RepID=A0A1Y2BQ22_9FUNG|nr:guanine nucleotide binding protein, alpha subunit [Rhizoclosmatium globosum]|eukprot:ORY36851.1 guanine nucleotide binding protein, alpha subunit [Rhizoclosmatium globosum]